MANIVGFLAARSAYAAREAQAAMGGQLQRIGSFLMRRGFDAETVRGALREGGADEMTDNS